MYHFEELKPRRKREMLNFTRLLALVVATRATVMAENVCVRERETERERCGFCFTFPRTK
jgi:hypothetical protein